MSFIVKPSILTAKVLFLIALLKLKKEKLIVYARSVRFIGNNSIIPPKTL